MVAHAFHGVAAALQSLAEDLRVLDLLRVDLAWVEAAGEVTELLCRIVLTVVDPLGDDVEAVDEAPGKIGRERSEEHTSELQSLMRISYAVFCLKKKKKAKI